jgi:cysteine desulfurase/selenocysteine lyase
MKFFGGKDNRNKIVLSERKDFEYLSENTMYFDSACQTLRPQPVVDAQNKYFYEYNACGGRVKYEWGKRVDREVEETREKVLDFLNKSKKEYETAFTLNTTYGLNLILQQLPKEKFKQVITSEIEHNSVFLSTVTAAKSLDISRKILLRSQDGSLDYKKEDFSGAVVVLNLVSNIDGRILKNAKNIAEDVHNAGGIFIIDGAQSMMSGASFLNEIDFDALCFSGHKMHGPSIGGIVIKRELLSSLELSFVGGGMVERLDKESFSIPENDPVSSLEPGLQNFSAIIALGACIDWLKKYKPEGVDQKKQKQKLAKLLFDGLSSVKGVHILNKEPSTTISFYSEDVDAHRLAAFLSQQNIMVRSGYFCCHYYLQNLKKYPPLLRISLGLHNTENDVNVFLEIFKKIINNIK